MDFTDSKHPESVEIKSGQTYHDRFAAHVRRVAAELDLPQESRHVVTCVESSYISHEINVWSAQDWLSR